jgi:sulfane dehydrogenase subunit SoxC
MSRETYRKAVIRFFGRPVALPFRIWTASSPRTDFSTNGTILVFEPVYSREETSKYTDLLPDGKAREFTFYMDAKSIITYPSGGQKLKSHGFHEISGIAWTGRGKIKRVDVSVDDGKSWQEAQLQEPVLTRALTRFRLPWRWDGSPAVIQSRAIDETGYVQPTLSDLVGVRGDNSVYHNNAIQPWRIAADGEVTNANA